MTAAGSAVGRDTTGVLARWWLHALAYGLLLVVVAPFVGHDIPFTPDEGLYGEQVEALDQGGWAWQPPADDIDPTGRWNPLVNAERGATAVYPYVRHPTYVVALWGSHAVAGVAGLHLVSLAGAVAGAVAAWFLARELGVSPVVSFWVAAASPLVVNAHVIWAHSLGTALAGATAVAAVRFHRRGSRGAGMGLALTSAALVLVRTEGLLWAAALGVALFAASLGRRGWRGAASRAAPVGAGLVAFIIERAVVAAIVEDGGARSVGGIRGVRQAGGSYLEGRLRGAWGALFEPATGGGAAVVVGVAALGLVVAAVVVARRRLPGAGAVVPVLLVLAVAAVAARLVAAPEVPMGGLLVAWPVVMVGILVPRRTESKNGPAADGWWLGLAVALFVVAVLLTQYENAGGLEWGGRFLTPAVPVLAVAAAAGAAALARAFPLAVAPLVALAVVPAVGGLVMLHEKADADRAVVQAVAAAGGEAIVTHSPVLPRYGWRVNPPAGWYVVPPADLDEALSRLAAAGVGSATVVQPAAGAEGTDGSSPALERLGWTMRVVRLGR